MLRGARRLVVVGTGSFDDLGQAPWQMPAWMLRWCAVARVTGAVVQLLAVGVGPIASPVNRFLFGRAVAASNLRAFRDNYSLDYAVALGVGRVQDRVVPDLVFAWPLQWLPDVRPAQSPPKVIGVGLMAYFGWNAEEAVGRGIYESYVAKMARF